MKKTLLAAVAVAALSLSVQAQAAPIVLTFEGIGDHNPVGNFYASQGVVFSSDTLALVDQDAGGSGNIANEPSGSTVMFFLNSNNAILDFATGFTTGFSFFYSSAFQASVSVWDGLNGTGNQLGTLNLDAQHDSNCSGDPNGQYCNWTPVGVNFNGTAKSINFGGTANFVVFDDITFGSATPGVVPEPGTWALMIGGFGMAGAALRSRRRALTA